MDTDDGSIDKGYYYYFLDYDLCKILPFLKVIFEAFYQISCLIDIYRRNGKNPFMFFQKANVFCGDANRGHADVRGRSGARLRSQGCLPPVPSSFPAHLFHIWFVPTAASTMKRTIRAHFLNEMCYLIEFWFTFLIDTLPNAKVELSNCIKTTEMFYFRVYGNWSC